MEENRERFAEDDPRRHTIRIRDMLSEVRDHLREDIAEINEPRAEALFETTAETLDGLITAFEDYERGQEEAWRENAYCAVSNSRTDPSSTPQRASIKRNIQRTSRSPGRIDL